MESSTKNKRYCYEDIYNVVLKSQLAAMNMTAPGVLYSTISTRSFEILLEGLVELGLLKGSVSELFEKQIHYKFMPHSLGHFIGFKTHDVGLQVKPESITTEDPEKRRQALKKYSSVGAVVLEPGMVKTIEPGIYFIQILIDEAKKNEAMEHENLFSPFCNHQP